MILNKLFPKEKFIIRSMMNHDEIRKKIGGECSGKLIFKAVLVLWQCQVL